MQRVEAEKGRVKWAENAMRETYNAVPADAPLWERMSADEFAAVELALGGKVVKSGDVWWRQVRPFFYRPLLPYRELRPGTLRYPLRFRMGGRPEWCRR